MSLDNSLDSFRFHPELSTFRAASPIHESECDPIRILVVDDDKGFCRLLAELLESHGYAVDWATHALEAFKMAQQKNYELFVIDVHMPVILGIDLAKGLKEDKPAVKIILISAFANKSLIDQAKKLGLPLLCKPFANETFLDLVAKTGNA
jgi:two-component system, response regulator, stage 0 sporulation protein F